MASDLPDDNQIQQSQGLPDTRILTLNLLQVLARQSGERVRRAAEMVFIRNRQKGKILVAEWLVKSSQPDSTDFGDKNIGSI